MKSTLEYLEEAKNAKGIKSDNAFALSIGITRSSISNLKNNRNVMDDFTCIQIAGILGVNPMEIIAAANYEREKVGERKDFWLNFLQQYTRSTAAGVVLLASLTGTSLLYSKPAEAQNHVSESATSYYYRKFCKALSRRLKKLLQTKNPLLAGFFRSALRENKNY